VQAFVTQTGVTDYWVGPTGQAPAGVYDTGLNLTDFRIVKPKSVRDRSNFRPLGHMDETPITARLFYSDRQPRTGRPAVWRQDSATPSIINVYPAPDNQNVYSPQPTTPILGVVSGGALPARLYYVTVTYVDSLGNESTAPITGNIYVPAGMLLQVYAPQEPEIASASGIQYNRYNVYAASAGTNESQAIVLQNTIQQATNIDVHYPWFESPSGLVTTGPNPPSTNNVMPVMGYVIEFRYFRQRGNIIDAGQVLQIPDDYRDTFVHGVDALTFKYLTRPQESMQSYQLYREGLTQIVRDLNFISKGGEYVQPDGASLGRFLPAIETIDLSVLTP